MKTKPACQRLPKKPARKTIELMTALARCVLDGAMSERDAQMICVRFDAGSARAKAKANV